MWRRPGRVQTISTARSSSGYVPTPSISTVGLQLYYNPLSSSSYPGSGTSIYDLSGNNYTGTLMNGVGYSSGVLTFDGSNDYIDVNQSVALADSFTLLAWIKVSDVTAYRMIFSKETTAGTPWNYRMYVNMTNGVLVGDIAPSTGPGAGLVGTNSVADNTWHMVAFVRNTTTDRIYSYIDGNEEASATDPTTGTISNSQELWIGRSAFTASGASPTGSYPYKGSLGQQLIYNRALSAAEISTTFAATRSGSGV